jgi:hypothetical protein
MNTGQSTSGGYVYIRSETGLWTVGFYDPAGKWQPESDHGSSEEAAERARHLNGGAPASVEGTELFAKIKKSSEYYHQHDGKTPFPVHFGTSYGSYIVFGNQNRYRTADLRFYVKVDGRFVALS